MAEYARRERICAERRRAGGKGGRAGGRATEQFDVAQLRAGECDRADAVGGGHATRESRKSPLRARRAKAAMSGGREQPPVGGHRGGGQARDGVDLVLLVSLVGWVCSSSAQKEAKNSAAVLSVYILDAPFSARPESWLVVARGASARLRLVGHLGWVHQHEARPVGQPRERMGGRRERRTAGRDQAGLGGKSQGANGGVRISYIIHLRSLPAARSQVVPITR